ncbi:FAD binding domain-containing protein [Chloroflexota bacterium]
MERPMELKGINKSGVAPWEKLLDGVSSDIELLTHYNASTTEKARRLLRQNAARRARIISGGTDILRILRIKYLPELPATLVNIKTIPALTYIKEESGTLKIGALTRLSDIEHSELIRTQCPILAETAAVVASPQVRNMATIAGSICQDPCCWYYRADKNYFHCWRKGGDSCPAQEGDNRWMFTIFASPQGDECHAACQSDMAITLAALGASVKTTRRTIPLAEFYTLNPPGNVLEADELITEIQVPSLAPQTRVKYLKFAIRKSIDHPLVSVACITDDRETRIAIGGVSLSPYRPKEAEDLIMGKKPDSELAQKAGELAVRNATPMSMNDWKVQVAKTLVARAILGID